MIYDLHVSAHNRQTKVCNACNACDAYEKGTNVPGQTLPSLDDPFDDLFDDLLDDPLDESSWSSDFDLIDLANVCVVPLLDVQGDSWGGLGESISTELKVDVAAVCVVVVAGPSPLLLVVPPETSIVAGGGPTGDLLSCVACCRFCE